MTAVLIGLLAASSVVYPRDVLLVTEWPGNLLKVRPPVPKPPFRFVSEEDEGRSPKMMVRDARGALWEVKFGNEVKAEVFATKLVSALGYYTDVTHYVAHGRLVNRPALKRTAQYVDAEGRFHSARFEYRDPSLLFLQDGAWTWEDSRFRESRALRGLKIAVMLLSNWDNKDATDRSSNTGVLERRSRTDRTRIYYVTDWGGSMGRWGRKFFHNKWNCEDFAEQSDEFIKEIDEDGEVKFGFSTGYHGGDFKNGITVPDVKWIAHRLRGITDSQLRAALRQSGATSHEATHFAAALRFRMNKLERLAKGDTANGRMKAARPLRPGSRVAHADRLPKRPL